MSSAVRRFFASKLVFSSCKESFLFVSSMYWFKTVSSGSFQQQIQSELQLFIVVRCSKSMIWLLSSSNYFIFCRGLRGSTETMQLSRKSMYFSFDRDQIPTRFVSFVLLIVSQKRTN
ncbi:Hypothetical_protein [Hexamita inflata]|uniref:Hypothetical_protein n=1 Tax=Hexamita inflata TaxID=28002 RepID=A0AA86P7T4_9EUKA|nr:Hypothetical protein HINF_LOCUS21229 [Hexamita inflata]